MRASISFFEIGAFPILVFTFNHNLFAIDIKRSYVHKGIANLGLIRGLAIDLDLDSL